MALSAAEMIKPMPMKMVKKHADNTPRSMPEPFIKLERKVSILEKRIEKQSLGLEKLQLEVRLKTRHLSRNVTRSKVIGTTSTGEKSAKTGGLANPETWDPDYSFP